MKQYLVRVRPLVRFFRDYLVYKIRNIAALIDKKPKVIVLSLGKLGRSLSVAEEAKKAGFHVHIFCPEFPQEAVYASSWTKIDCRNEIERAIEIATNINPVAILVEEKNLLLPAQNAIASALSLPSIGEKATQTSNSKIALRESLDDANLMNLEWHRLDTLKNGTFKFPAILKPDMGTASKGVKYVADERELALDNDYLSKMGDDPSVGGGMLLETYVKGRQFDVEGIASNGQYFIFGLVEEFYEAHPPYFPPSWFHFNPPLSVESMRAITKTVFSSLKALGVKQGAWHMELRIDQNGNVYPLDYANRMGYNIYVSEAAGTSFAGAYVEAMTKGELAPPSFDQKSLLCIYALDLEMKEKLLKLTREQPSAIKWANFDEFEFSYHQYYATVVVKTNNYDELVEILTAHDLLPEKFPEFYLPGQKQPDLNNDYFRSS